MRVSAFIRSYHRDFEWLRFCLASLEMRGDELLEIVVAVPENELAQLRSSINLGRARSISVPVYSPIGYIDQQITKCHADLYCKGDFILHFDSDCMAAKRIQVAEFFADDQPKMLIRRWEDCGDAQCWRPITQDILRKEPSFETMASLPIIYHRSSHELFRRHIAALYDCDFLRYVSALTSFSEFNAIGNFCHQFTPDAYRFLRATGEEGYPRPLKQFWSHGEMREKEMKALL